MHVYRNIVFPAPLKKPYFFSNFVTTIDGRTAIKNTPAYDHIGSMTDFDTFLDLRKYADALIHGKHTAATHRTVDTIAQKPFLEKRKKQGKEIILPYFIVSNRPDASLLAALVKNPMKKPYLVTHTKARIAKNILELVTVIRIGKTTVDLNKFSDYLFDRGYTHVLIEGGPTLMGSFLALELIDEMFQTIAPKIFNGESHQFLTLTEGKLLSPHTSLWKLISAKIIHDEVFLRYRKRI